MTALMAHGNPNSLACRWCDQAKYVRNGVLICRTCDGPIHPKP